MTAAIPTTNPVARTRRPGAVRWMAACVLPWLLCHAAYAATTIPKLPRLPNGKPDFSGIWQTTTPADDDLEAHAGRKDAPPSAGVVEGGAIPYLPQALAQKHKNFDAREQLDPRTKGWTLGVPRGLYYPEPFQIFQRPRDLKIVYQFGHTVRTIHTNNTQHPDDLGELLVGDSRATWEGDTLVTDVRGFTDQTWLDRAGNFHSTDLHVVERWTYLDANTIAYKATLDDPQTYSRPWSLNVILHRHREPHFQLIEDYRFTLDFDNIYPPHRDDKAATANASTPTQAAPAPAIVPPPEKATPQIASGPWLGPKTPDGQPDITGFWGSTFGGYLNFTDPEGISTGELPRANMPPRAKRAPSRVSDPADGQVPFQPWAQDKVKEYQTFYPNPIKPEYVDPLARCAPSGIPQSLYMHGYEIYQYPGYIVFLFDQGTRIIHLDDQPHLPANVRLWNGDSRGHWEGNTLVVSVGNYNGKSKYGRSGEFASENVQIEERYVFDQNGQRFNYIAQITDPTVYTRPFTVTVPVRRYTDKDKPRAMAYAVRQAKHAGKDVIIEPADERACIEFNSGHAHLTDEFGGAKN